MEELAAQKNRSERERRLAWDGCYNVRDLGGLPTLDDEETLWRRVIRSDLLGRLTLRGRRSLVQYGVRTIIDLRGPQEVNAEPSPFAVQTDDGGALAYLNLPMEEYHLSVSTLITQAETRADVYMIILDHYPDAVAGIMRAILYAQPGGVVVHCHAGKDRTGIVAALLLGLARVPLGVIAADYAQSEAQLWPLYEQMVSESGGEANTDPWLKPTARPETLYALFNHLQGQYDGVQAYLETAGMTRSEIVGLRRRLLR